MLPFELIFIFYFITQPQKCVVEAPGKLQKHVVSE